MSTLSDEEHKDSCALKQLQNAQTNTTERWRIGKRYWWERDGLV